MTVPCPACEWPTSLDERGPAEDPSILLTGTARFGEATLQVVAIRVNRVSRASPDYKPEVSEECYQAGGLDVALEEAFDELDCAADQLSEFLSASRQNVVTLSERPYRLWLLSAPAGS